LALWRFLSAEIPAPAGFAPAKAKSGAANPALRLRIFMPCSRFRFQDFHLDAADEVVPQISEFLLTD